MQHLAFQNEVKLTDEFRVVETPLRFIPTKSQKGAALVEAAIIIPLFVILIFGILDVAPAIHDYLQLTQVTHEAYRIASGTPELNGTTDGSTGELFLFETRFDFSTVPPQLIGIKRFFPNRTVSPDDEPETEPDSLPRSHGEAHERAAISTQLLGLHNRLENITFFIGLDDTPANRIIHVSIEANYNSLLGIFLRDPIRLRVSERGTYLN